MRVLKMNKLATHQKIEKQSKEVQKDLSSYGFKDIIKSFMKLRNEKIRGLLKWM